MINPKVRPFRFWSQKVLPLVYDDSLSYYEVLCKLADHVNDQAVAINELDHDLQNIEIQSAGGYVYPESFGAVGDGVTDDTTALQNAINDATNKKIPVLLSGQYAVTGLEVGQCIIIGNNGHTQLVGLNDNDYVITFTNNGGLLQGFSINAKHGVKFGTYSNRVLSNVCERISVYNCLVGFYHPTTGGYNKMIDCYVTLLENGKGYVIGPFAGDISTPRTVGTNYVYIDKCVVQSKQAWSTTTVGIEINECEYLWLSDTDIVGCNIGLETSIDHTNFTNGKIRDCVFFGCRKGIMLQRGASGRVFNIVFDSCTFGYSVGEITSRQTSVGNVSNITFNACQIAYTGENNIQLSSPTMTIYYASINRLDITSRSDLEMTYESNVTHTGAVFKEVQRPVVDIYIASGGSATYAFGSTNSLEPLKKPYVALYDPDDAFPVYTHTKNANGTWTISFSNVPAVYNGCIM